MDGNKYLWRNIYIVKVLDVLGRGKGRSILSMWYITYMSINQEHIDKLIENLAHVYNPLSRKQKLLLRYFRTSQKGERCHVSASLFCQHDMTKGDKILTTLRCRLSRFLSISVSWYIQHLYHMSIASSKKEGDEWKRAKCTRIDDFDQDWFRMIHMIRTLVLT